MSGLWITAFLLLAAAVFVLGLIQFGFLRRTGVVLQETERLLSSKLLTEGQGLPPGSQFPSFQALAGDGSIWTSSESRGRPFLLVFLDEACEPCRVLAHEIQERPNLPRVTNVVVVTEGEGFPELSHLDTGVTVVRQSGRQVSNAFGIKVAPIAFAVDQLGTIVAREIANHIEELESLARLLGEGVVTPGERIPSGK